MTYTFLTGRFYLPRLHAGALGCCLCLLVAGILLIGAGQVAAQSDTSPKSIFVATPEWVGQTNADGSGLFFDILRRVYAPEGVEIKFQLVPWKRAEKMVADQEADAMLSVWREYAVRQNQWVPRYPLFVEYTAVVFKKERLQPWKGIASLDKKRAVWLRGYGYNNYAQFAIIRFAEWLEVDAYERAWKLIAKGRCDVYIDALIDMEHYIARHKVDMQPYRLKTLWGEKAYVGFAPSPRTKALIAIYNRRMQELLASGEMEAIHAKWGARYDAWAWDPGTPSTP